MDGEKRRAEARDLGDRPLDGVGDVVQLEVQEDLPAGGDEPLDEAEFAAIGELHADLVEAGAVADPRDEPLGLRNVGHVERDDQPVARRNLVAHEVSGSPRRAMPRKSVSLNPGAGRGVPDSKSAPVRRAEASAARSAARRAAAKDVERLAATRLVENLVGVSAHIGAEPGLSGVQQTAGRFGLAGPFLAKTIGARAQSRDQRRRRSAPGSAR